jgi:hypothetical protein
MSSTPAASSHASSGASHSVLALPPSFLSTPYLSDPRLPVTSAGLSPLRSASPNPGAVFSAPVPLQPLPSPTLASVDPRTLALLSIAAPASPAERAALAEAFAGNALLPGSTPAAHCYAGHQFGSFSGQLGDGANLNLGLAPGGHWLQLKGSGKTPYSRTADGRKVLRSTIREYVAGGEGAAESGGRRERRFWARSALFSLTGELPLRSLRSRARFARAGTWARSSWTAPACPPPSPRP